MGKSREVTSCRKCPNLPGCFSEVFFDLQPSFVGEVENVIKEQNDKQTEVIREMMESFDKRLKRLEDLF